MFLEAGLLQQCSPNIDPVVAHAIVKTESVFNPFAIGVNTGSRLKRQPTSYQQALPIVNKLLAEGKNIDVGLAQINSSNFNWLRLTPADALNPCANLRAMQKVYRTCYAQAGSTGLGTRMQRAFSCYNTGSMTKGFRNGYVKKATRNYNEYAHKLASKPQKQLPPPQYQVDNYPLSSSVPSNAQDLALQAEMLERQRRGQIQNQHQPIARATISQNSNFNRISNEPPPTQKPPKARWAYATWDVFREF